MTECFDLINPNRSPKGKDKAWFESNSCLSLGVRQQGKKLCLEATLLRRFHIFRDREKPRVANKWGSIRSIRINVSFCNLAMEVFLSSCSRACLMLLGKIEFSFTTKLPRAWRLWGLHASTWVHTPVISFSLISKLADWRREDQQGRGISQSL